MVGTATSRPNRGFVGGWLSMAPESENAASPTASSSRLDLVASPPTASSTHASISSPRRGGGSSSSTHPRRATFQLGAVDDTSTIPTPVTPASRSSSASMMSPVFDVRASFLPMTFNKKPTTNIQSENTVDLPSKPSNALPTSDGGHKLESEDFKGSMLHNIEDDGKGLEFAGRRWKGKTAHAVEQELEQVGDTTIMSYAPDAVYLASRLEGLRRNLEAGGEEARGRRWLPTQEEDDLAELAASEVDEAPVPLAVEEADCQRSPKISPPAKLSPPRLLLSDDTSAPTLEAPSAKPTVREDRLPATLPPHITDLIQPPPLIVHDAPADLTPAAKAAALDSRVEIRLLRRSDLEQVRELHCLHGDNDKVDTEHYATSAAFLLRLLVDETHVCLVAVAKPLPAPDEPFDRKHHFQQKHLWPAPPPPSMDMPASSVAYVLAGQGLSSNSPLLRPIDALAAKRNQTRSPRAPASSLGRHSPILGATVEEREGSDSDADSTRAELDEDDEDEDSFSVERLSSPEASNGQSPDSSLPEPSPAKAAGASYRVPLLPPLTPIAGNSPPAGDNAQGEPQSLSGSYSSSNSLGSMALKRAYETAPAATTKARRARSSVGEDVSPPASTETSPSQSHLAPGHNLVLTGPTNEVAPPRALRVMVPPAPGASVENEVILGVASAAISIKPATESLWGNADASSSRAVKEVHVLTLSVARAERGLGLGGRLLDRLMDEALRRNISSAYRASMGRRIAPGSPNPSRIYLEVHPDSKHALALYKGRGFDAKRRLPGYFRGDARIPTNVRSLPGGSDAVLMEKWDNGEPA
ncbi:hypothetical protein BCV69DRAFT_281505 [Microstroma glucosiphilum]|uniref:N-acetyltransferase domain-containing protein n=1 Tax=Pseudomicrostroma glucosiphilum TaxID=1684307 RepID=A0A316UDU9_9BASI|nr:hypothetical protein BCV69DRAFT_281505 [Pseudomicrostroma glucosiphilum]PWN22521.1 hypothetical protein BCV69DRAFT_281505 [Pseudomicrostroma glucosiphilum]